MACDLGLNLDMHHNTNSALDETEEDARRITFWGCFLFDKYVSATNFVGHISTLPGFPIISKLIADYFLGAGRTTLAAFRNSRLLS